MGIKGPKWPVIGAPAIVAPTPREQVSVPDAPVTRTFERKTASGLLWHVEYAPASPRLGETIRGVVTLSGGGHLDAAQGVVTLSATRSRAKENLDIGGLVLNATGIDVRGAELRDAIPTKLVTKTEAVGSAETVISLMPVAEPADAISGSFELTVPRDELPRIAVPRLSVSWILKLSVPQPGGRADIAVPDIKVLADGDWIARTPAVQPGAMDATTEDERNGMRFSIEVGPLPLCCGRHVWGTATIAATPDLVAARASVAVAGDIRDRDAETGWSLPLASMWLTGDRVLADGRRQIDFEGDMAAIDFVTTEVGITRLTASVRVSLKRWGILGPRFERPVAVATAP